MATEPAGLVERRSVVQERLPLCNSAKKLHRGRNGGGSCRWHWSLLGQRTPINVDRLRLTGLPYRYPVC